MQNLLLKACPRCSVVQLRDPDITAHEEVNDCINCGHALEEVPTVLLTFQTTVEGSE